MICLQFQGQQTHPREKAKPSAPSKTREGAATRKTKTVSKGGPPARAGWAHSPCINTRDGKSYRLDELSRADIITLGDILCGYVQHPEIKSLGPDGGKCKAHTRGLLRRMAMTGGLQHCIGKEVSRFERGKNDFIENIDDVCIHYDRGRVVANESLIAEISKCGLRKATKQTGLDRKTVRAILKGNMVKSSTLAKVVNGLREEMRN